MGSRNFFIFIMCKIRREACAMFRAPSTADMRFIEIISFNDSSQPLEERKVDYTDTPGSTVTDTYSELYEIWLRSSRNDFIVIISVYSQLTEMSHLRSTPLEQLCTYTNDAVTV
jgi:hypothetical protein